MLKRLVLLLFLMLPLGCALHTPAQVELPVVPPSRYLESRPVTEVGSPLEQWWQAFNDEVLNQLMSELFEENLELGRALARLEQVDAAFKIAASGKSPSLSARGSVNRSRQPGLLKSFTGETEQLSLAAAFELDLWGKLAAQSRAASLELAASREDVQTLYLGLSATLADLYFLAVEQRAQLALTEQVVDSFAETAASVRRRYQNGLVPAVDMYQAEQSLAAAKTARSQFEATLARAEHAMAVLIGRYPQRSSGTGLEQLPQAPALFETGLPADLLARRPDIRAALQRVEAADARVAAAIAERFPAIDFSGSYGSTRQELTAGLLKGEFWNLLGNLTMPLLDGGRRKTEVVRKEAALGEAVAAYQQKILTAFQDVEDALANNLATEQRVQRISETAAAAGASLRLSTQLYLAGLTDYLPVLTAQRADFDFRSRLLASQRQLLSDRISLARSLGGSWMQEKIQTRLQKEEDAKQ